MSSRLGFVAKQVFYDLRAGLLLRPGVITVALASAALGTAYVESRWPAIDEAIKGLPWVSSTDVAAAQLVLNTIASSTMTVLSITYSVMLMALTLASIQFSPRILVGFMRDKASQNTIGLFVGTFLYCLLLLRLIHGDPNAFIPQIAMLGAVALALACLGWLIYFIHHIAQRIQANFIVDHIATETEIIIDEVFPRPLDDAHASPEGQRPTPPAGLGEVLASCSGYVQLIDEEGFVELARQHGVTLHLHRGPGEFAAQGEPLVSVSPASKLTDALRVACNEAYDLGPIRTMQQDVEFGVRQIVDIALKAISPAVNDPSTAVTCIDHLARLLMRAAGRRDPEQELRDGESLRVQLRRTTFRRVLDLAFNQIRQYGRTDMAVALRLLRALHMIALSTRHKGYLEAVQRQTKILVEQSRPSFHAGDCAEFDGRHQAILRTLAERGVG